MPSADNKNSSTISPKRIYLSEDQSIYLEYTCDFSNPASDFKAVFMCDGTLKELSRKQYDYVYAIDLLYENRGVYPVKSGNDKIDTILNNFYSHKPSFINVAEEHRKSSTHLLIKKKDHITQTTNYHFHFPSPMLFERILNPAFPANECISANRKTSLARIKRQIEKVNVPYLIYGPEGIGKTAFIVQLYKMFCESPRINDAHYFFIKYTSDLKKKIAYEIRLRNSYANDEEAFKAFLDYTKEHKVILFIDGLPETLEDKNRDTLSILSNSANIKLVMTSVSKNHNSKWKTTPLASLSYFKEIAKSCVCNKLDGTEQWKEIVYQLPGLVNYNTYVYKLLCLTTKYGFSLSKLINGASEITPKAALVYCIDLYSDKVNKYKNNHLTDDVKIYLSLLCAMPNLEAISINLLKKAILGAKESDINFLINSGLVEYYERVDSKGNSTTYCFMHPITRDELIKLKILPCIDSEFSRVAEQFAKFRGYHSFTIENGKIIDKPIIHVLSQDNDDGDIDTLVKTYASAEKKRDSNTDDLNSLADYKEAAKNAKEVIDRLENYDEYILIWKSFYYTGYLLTFCRETLDEGIEYLNYALSLAIYIHFNKNIFDAEQSALLVAKSADHLSFALSNNIILTTDDIKSSYELNAFSDHKIIELCRTNNVKDIFKHKFDNPLALIKTAYAIRNNDEYWLPDTPNDEEIKRYRERAWTADNYGFTLLYGNELAILEESYEYLEYACSLRNRLNRITGKYQSDLAWTAHNLAINATLKCTKFNSNSRANKSSAISNYNESYKLYEKINYTDDCKASILNNMSIHQYLTDKKPDLTAIEKQMKEAIKLYVNSERTEERKIIEENLDIMINGKSVQNLKMLSGARVIVPISDNMSTDATTSNK